MKIFNGIFVAVGFSLKRVYQLLHIRIERAYYKSRFYRIIDEFVKNHQG